LESISTTIQYMMAATMKASKYRKLPAAIALVAGGIITGLSLGALDTSSMSFGFGVDYDPSGVWHVLRGMGWTCQKPERRAREGDEKAIARWRARDWPRIKKRSKKRS
jgi:hypothetical protein